MSTTAGYFDETILNEVRVTAASMMLDDRIKQQFIPKYDAIQAIQAVQTPNLGMAFPKNKINNVEIIWENTCGLEVEDNVTCVIGGTKTSTNIKEYTLSYEKVVKFSVDEADFIDNEFGVESAIAKAMLRADKQLTEAYTQYCIGQLNLFAGQNKYTGGKGTVAGLTTTIPAAFWDSTIMAYLELVGIKNRFTSPVYLTGDNLYESIWVANANAGNANGRGEPVMWNSSPIFFDLFNVDTVNTPTVRTYMLSQNSLAMASRNLNPDAVTVVHNVHTKWTQPSRFLPFKYDVFYNAECTTNDLIQHNFKVKLVADLFRNPIGCEELNHGILTFDCV